jgi:hypothetical protein
MKLSLQVLSEGKASGTSIPITLSQFVIGRDPQCNLRPGSPIISKRHCAVLVKGNAVFVRDFDSTNGTFLNDKQVKQELQLKHGDILKVGPLTFKVNIEGVPVDAPTPLPPRAGATPLPPQAGAVEAAATENESAAAAEAAGNDEAAEPAGPEEESAATVEAAGTAEEPAAAEESADPEELAATVEAGATDASSAPAVEAGGTDDDSVAAMLLGSLHEDSAADTGEAQMTSEVPSGTTEMDLPHLPAPDPVVAEEPAKEEAKPAPAAAEKKKTVPPAEKKPAEQPEEKKPQANKSAASVSSAAAAILAKYSRRSRG